MIYMKNSIILCFFFEKRFIISSGSTFPFTLSNAKPANLSFTVAFRKYLFYIFNVENVLSNVSVVTGIKL